MVEYTYNNNYPTAITMTPYKGLYETKCHTLVCQDKIEKRKALGLELICITTNKVKVIK